jgi:hypothetical protein
MLHTTASANLSAGLMAACPDVRAGQVTASKAAQTYNTTPGCAPSVASDNGVLLCTSLAASTPICNQGTYKETPCSKHGPCSRDSEL